MVPAHVRFSAVTPKPRGVPVTSFPVVLLWPGRGAQQKGQKKEARAPVTVIA